ncbi:hypothetical protein [Chthonomonas calidirosea]|uniref:hypothetical protein n=1 Tax=Chthonomonas calidirosea TaxID=454171 RepID=UPI0012E3B099|nr:hypothetical protein [Chthonomonas calidirosea]
MAQPSHSVACSRHSDRAFGTPAAACNGCFAAINPSWLLPETPFYMLLLASPPVLSVLPLLEMYLHPAWQKPCARSL